MKNERNKSVNSTSKIYLVTMLIILVGTAKVEIIINLSFLADEILDNIVSHRNMYAHHVLTCKRFNNTHQSLFHLFKDVSRDMIYIAIQLLMGIVNKPHYHMYWLKDNFLSTSIFGSYMRCD